MEPRLKSALAVSALCLAGTALADDAVIQRELHVVIDVEASQSWESHTEEYGHQHWDADTTQRYELRTTLQSDTGLHTRNILNPDQQKRLRAKTIHLARQARRRIEASGNEFTIPRTPEEKADLNRQLQEEQAACGADMACRDAVMQRYVAIFAVLDNPGVLDPATDEGTPRYRYFEPFSGCDSQWQVEMQMTMTGTRYSEAQDEVVPFTEKRTADQGNVAQDVPLCQRFLAVMDAGADTQPFYLENVYVPSAEGETVITEAGYTRRKTESQPMVPGVLGWATQQLRHAEPRGEISAEIPLKFALNNISEESGSSKGTAEVTLRWSFTPVGED